ncbi:MAG TPA: bifunctional riboflavin kinase/FAD synthetase [Bryobacteraceae bacterium]|nr:bifunctional riboflavin kinase/FAD synthetase [Bryobacteraceae bacterium]
MSCRRFDSLGELPRPFGPCVVTIGNFDGVHAGHRALIRRTIDLAREGACRAVALTFHPHPTCVVAPQKAPPLLSTIDQRTRMMCHLGLDAVVVLPFTAEIARLTAEEFVRLILVDALGASAVVVGDNFRFGRGAQGHVDTLSAMGAELGFRTEIAAAVRCRGRVVSSTEVRQSVQRGDVAFAWRMLQRPYALEGEVVSGAGVGAKKTVPTLNLSAEAEVLPARGVYITRTHDSAGRVWPSVTNVGYRPTFGGEHLTIETFLLSALEGDAPRRIRVEFLHRLRDEKKFESPEDLKRQILRDAARAQEFHGRAARMLQALDSL